MRLIIFALAMILCDIITGILKAVYKGNINSTYLRKGLLHKVSEIVAIGVCYIIEYGIAYAGLNIDLHIAAAIAIYISLMEIISVLENISEVNSKLSGFLKPYLEKLKGDETDAEGD